MRFDVEKRLHRVKIELDNENVNCPVSKECKEASNCDRCNVFYEKCVIYKKKIS